MSEHDQSRNDPLDEGIAAGFGPESAPPAVESILDLLARNSGVRPRVSLRDEPSQHQARLLKPMAQSDQGLPKNAGKYQLQGEIAHGGVGVVLKGHDTDLGRDVAMKFLHEKYKDEPAKA